MTSKAKFATAAIVAATMLSMSLVACSPAGDNSGSQNSTPPEQTQTQQPEQTSFDPSEYLYEDELRGAMPKLETFIDLDGKQITEVLDAAEFGSDNSQMRSKSFRHKDGSGDFVSVSSQNLTAFGELITDPAGFGDSHYNDMPILGDATDPFTYGVSIPGLTMDEVMHDQGVEFEWFAVIDEDDEPIFAGLARDVNGHAILLRGEVMKGGYGRVEFFNEAVSASCPEVVQFLPRGANSFEELPELMENDEMRNWHFL